MQCYLVFNLSAFMTEHFDQTDSDSEVAQTTTTDFMPQGAPSYPDFLIGYPTQSGKYSSSV